MLSNSVKRNRVAYIQLSKILFLLSLWTFVAISSSKASKADTTTSNRIIATASNKSATPLMSLPIYMWGHTTKYASVLYDEDVIVKGSSNVLDIKYPEIGDTNNMTIIGIYASESDKLDTATTTVLLTAENFSIYLLEGGIGHNFTTVRFVSNVGIDVKYNLKIYCVDI